MYVHGHAPGIESPGHGPWPCNVNLTAAPAIYCNNGNARHTHVHAAIVMIDQPCVFMTRSHSAVSSLIILLRPAAGLLTSLLVLLLPQGLLDQAPLPFALSFVAGSGRRLPGRSPHFLQVRGVLQIVFQIYLGSFFPSSVPQLTANVKILG